MSYDISLRGPDGEPLPTDHFVDGGTHNIYGTNACDLNVTGNYWQVWDIIEFSPRDLHGKEAKNTLNELALARLKLAPFSKDPQPWAQDYWAPTPGNCLVVIDRLLAWAKEHPDGVWSVTG